MQFRLNKYLIEQSTRYLRRLFTYNTQWSNKDIELIQISSGSSNMVFEQYFVEAEKYPIITISTSGGTYTQAALNDLMRVVNDDTISLGERLLITKTISDTQQLQLFLPSTAIGETIRGIDFYNAWSRNDVGGDNININVYKNSTTIPVLIGSGSLEGHTNSTLSKYFTEFNENITLTGQDFSVILSTASGSSYYIAIDNTSGNYKYIDNNISTSLTGSIVGNLYLPSFIRMGTTFQSSLNFKVHAKNDTAILYNISELIVMYFTLAKYGQISRASTATNGIKLSELELETSVSELTEKGIFVKGIRQGGLEVRKRGEKDIIFSITVTIDFFTEWFEDYTADTLKDITVEANTYLQNLQNEA